jgi:thymidylate kinase
MSNDHTNMPAVVGPVGGRHRERPEDRSPGVRGRGLAQAVLAGFDEAGVRWCLLRGAPERLTAGDDVDILVAAADLARATGVIDAHGLIRLQSYGRGSHTFYIGLDPVGNSWVELDLVTEIAYGRHFEVGTAAAGECLARRGWRDGAWVLAPADEFWALLLHCVLDKNAFSRRHMWRLKHLEHMASLDSPLVRTMPSTMARTLLEHWRAERWADFRAWRRALLAAWWRTYPVSSARRFVGSIALRLVERPLQAWSRRGASVALLGPDGSGKSTLAKGIESAFYFPVRRVYMGLWPSNETPHSIAAQGLRILLRPLTIWRRYLMALRHRALGRMVVFDRYVYDALLPPRRPLVWFKRPYFQLLSRLCPSPDLVLLLDAPGPVMHSRCGEYDPEHLEAEREQYQQLRRRIPRLERLDAQRPPELVLADAVARIWQHYVARAAR